MKWWVLWISLLLGANVYASNMTENGDCINCGGELPLAVRGGYSYTQIEVASICQLFTRGGFISAEKIGVEIFGSVENFWENIHRFECPPHYPNPVFIHFERNQSARRDTLDLLTKLEGVSEENRLKVLNRPRGGMRHETILDTVERVQQLMRNGHDQSFVRILGDYIERLRAMGAKRASELD